MEKSDVAFWVRGVTKASLGLLAGWVVAAAAVQVNAEPVADNETPTPAAKSAAAPAAATPGRSVTSTAAVAAGSPSAGGDSAAANVTAQVADVVKMTESGVAPGVVQTYVEQNASLLPPSAAELIYLHQHGIPAQTITAFIQRAGELRAQNERAAKEARSQAAQAPPSAPTVIPAPGYAEGAPATAPAYVEPAPVYTYPVYSYPAYASYPGFYPSYSWSYWYRSPGFSFSYWPTWRYSHAGYWPRYRNSVSFGYRGPWGPASGYGHGSRGFSSVSVGFRGSAGGRVSGGATFGRPSGGGFGGGAGRGGHR